MTYRLFEGKDHASSYWKFRISPSDNLIQQVLDFLEKHKGHPFELAVDVGCGSGQGTVLLAKHFASMVATDVSPAQVEMALQHSKEPNITYKRSDGTIIDLRWPLSTTGSEHGISGQRQQ
ncbi:hypothetical protein NQZ68_007272 [Dissostichus eleginoides]|nr:hypothetical protein NQZ68_007272 [Dissostichus eleginoides]